jgi:hypothetical protein
MMSDSRQPAVIVQHPSAPVRFEPPPVDPRDQPVMLRDGDICTGCHCEVKLHWSAVSNRWVGCRGAQAQARPRNPERWNDPHAAVTLAVFRAMHEKCGPALDIFLNGFTHDERMAMAHALSMAAVSEYTKGLGK